MHRQKAHGANSFHTRWELPEHDGAEEEGVQRRETETPDNNSTEQAQLIRTRT